MKLETDMQFYFFDRHKFISKKNARGNRSDPAWKHGKDVSGNGRKILCDYCKDTFTGGIFRFKHHLAGTRKDVRSCTIVPDNVKIWVNSLLVKKRGLSNKRRRDIFDNVEIVSNLNKTGEEHRQRKKNGILPVSEMGDLHAHNCWKPNTPVKSASSKTQSVCKDLSDSTYSAESDNDFHSWEADLMEKNLSVATAIKLGDHCATSNPSDSIVNTGFEGTSFEASVMTTSVNNNFISVGQNILINSNYFPSTPNVDSTPSQPSFGLNTPRKRSINAVSSGISSSHFAPITPNQKGFTTLTLSNKRRHKKKRKEKSSDQKWLEKGLRRGKKPANSEPQEKERKCVRKNRVDITLEITSGEVASKFTDTRKETCERKSCKRSLNFDENSLAIKKSSSYRPTPLSKGIDQRKTTAVKWKKKPTVDEITEYEHKKALVLYKGVQTVMPFEGSFNPLQKRRQRAKVDLDEETSNVWRLLLQNISSNGVDGTDEEKVKWWEKERQLFQGRANSFIAQMHLIQGNRRFTPWKGSVVDSVVGVFLTQNVSDQASSSAFMSMAAHFSIKSNKSFEPWSKEMNKLIKEQKVHLKSSVTNHASIPVTNVVTSDLKKGNTAKKKKNPVNWDLLRLMMHEKGKRERKRTINTMDILDWEAVRQADVDEVANTIKERGMQNVLAEKIQAFLDRLVTDHGSIDLEWLRDAPPDKAKEYLLSVRGLGLKSTECVRLLTLHHQAFPVDTNIGRIAVRLGWVPLQPLPESLQLHLLELYPVLDSIQEYLWPRLCKLDHRTLYELHYQLITFGKVFCTKRKPNCNACPMRGECRHFASAFASARLALPGPEEHRIINITQNQQCKQNPYEMVQLLKLPEPQHNLKLITQPENHTCEPMVQIPIAPVSEEPIIEVPGTPEPEIQVRERDIGDGFLEDTEEIPTIKLNLEKFTKTLQNYMEGESKALVVLSQEAASIPMPKLKNVNQLRAEHLVYELPDTHSLLKGLDKREPDDPCPYLLAIWTPG